MKVNQIAELIVDKLIIYKELSDNGEFENLYKGDSSNIPSDIANMEVRIIAAAKKGIVDIQVN